MKSAIVIGVLGLAVLGVSLGAWAPDQPPSRRAAEPSTRAAEPAQGDPLIVQRTRGAATAPLTIYELSDFQCPYCKRQALETFPAIEREYIATGKVRWIFLNLPITQIHPNAVAAAELAMCAARVDKFWPIHHLLFTYQAKWSPLKDPAPFLISLADSAGIPREDILPCLQNREMRALVQSEAEGAAKSGVESTPTVYIEGAGLLRGAVPFPIYKQVLDSLLAEKAAP
ncbi:MAG: thioredoxin domain-containing protein [Gemmatimonadota bacterium]|nr:thioredoxin domain-containing protein [Gemmatimonadota bacterium]